MGNQNSISSADKFILQIKVQRDKLTKYQQRIALDQQRLKAQSRILISEQGNKRKACYLLKQVKMYDEQLGKIAAQQESLETLIRSIENSLIDKEVLKGLEAGNRVLANLQAEIPLTKVDEIMERLNDGIAYNQQVEENISQKEDMDDADIEMELNRLIEENPELSGIKNGVSSMIEKLDELHVPSSEPTNASTDRAPEKNARADAELKLKTAILN